MIASLKIELRKLKNNYILIFLLIFNILSVSIGCMIFYFNQSAFPNLNNRDLILWGQETLYTSQLFFPILIGVLVSISWQFEESNNNWMRMKTIPLKESKIIVSKFSSIFLLTLLNQIIFFLLFCISASIVNVSLEQLHKFIFWDLMGWIGTVSIIALQLYLSVTTRNFTFPILISTVGGVAGLLTLFISNFIFKIFPYSQITVGVRSRSLMNFNFSEMLLFLIINAIYIVTFLTLTILKLKKRED
ncbi:ABC transporter permease [Staphylococcus sp. SQ8-PEA]|uniref:ABC transporter permease n=1 Tax=Staphylococcus marylandisciuri TaxID=2981529 RepID=A0ABT2QR60_9STAP|nr:ABC transporter permease [Staphylococcus marylandisciuri]MCU5746471.1 ABC transporter permease [Staphylococcus marylandisciuri]